MIQTQAEFFRQNICVLKCNEDSVADQRHLQGEIMDSEDATTSHHYSKHVLTDLTLALLQDSNRYAAPHIFFSCTFMPTEGAISETQSARRNRRINC
jgi:hypothetical protein